MSITAKEQSHWDFFFGGGALRSLSSLHDPRNTTSTHETCLPDVPEIQKRMHQKF